jgi:hypothetical protein
MVRCWIITVVAMPAASSETTVVLILVEAISIRIVGIDVPTDKDAAVTTAASAAGAA